MSDIDNLFKEAELVPGPALQVTDQMELAKNFLSEKALTALSRESKTLTHKDETGDYTCIYLGYRVKTKDIYNGVSAICNALNALAEKDLIHSSLLKPSSISFGLFFLTEPHSAVVSYVLVPTDKKEEAEKLADCAYSDECSELKVLGSLETELGEDEFLAEINLCYPTLTRDSNSVEQRLQDEIQQYLNILPKGTEVVSVTECAVVTLSRSYEVRFKNPLMKAFKEVRPTYCRFAEKVGDKIEDFTLLISVEYIRKDGK